MIYDCSGVYRFDVVRRMDERRAALARNDLSPTATMYQPGERGQITGIAYYVANGKVVADRNASYHVTISRSKRQLDVASGP